MEMKFARAEWKNSTFELEKNGKFSLRVLINFRDIN